MSNYSRLYNIYSDISRRTTPILSDSKRYGYKCDIYFPEYGSVIPNEDYSEVDIFSTHENAIYADTPDLAGVEYYIPGLLKKQIMNSPSTEFENFYLEGDDARPFIECHFTLELPIASKVIVHFDEETKAVFFIEKKTKTPAGIFLRMYLNALV